MRQRLKPLWVPPVSPAQGASHTRFVTSNDAKFREVAAALRNQDIELEQLKIAYPEVQADTLQGVVEAALGWLAPRFGDDLLVDDSGLFVQTLGGFPGVYSAYAFRTLGCHGLLRLLEGEADRRGTFRTSFGLLREGAPTVLEGVCHGNLAEEERGQGGFGFDPIFVPEGETRTFAEMEVEEKNALSHRGRAVAALVRHLTGGST